MPAPNPLLDRPSWAPSWVPSIDGGPGLRALRWSLGLVLAAGLASCVSRGADSPADPVLGAASSTTSTIVSGTAPGATLTIPTETLPDGSEGDPTVSADPNAPDQSTTTPPGSLPSRLAAQFGTIMVEVLTASGQAVQLCLLHADTGPERSQGLMGVTDFEGYDGMLFANETSVDNQFFMAGTPTPLSITWWQEDGSFRNATDMEPCTDSNFGNCERYPSGGLYKWAIEVPKGALASAGIDEDATLTVGDEGCTPG